MRVALINIKIIKVKINIDIENLLMRLKICRKLDDEDIKINDAERHYKKALEIIFNIDSYLKKVKSKVERYEQ